MACDVLAPLFSLELEEELAEADELLELLLDVVLGAGAETTAVTALGCDDGVVLVVAVGELTVVTTGSSTVVVVGEVEVDAVVVTGSSNTLATSVVGVFGTVGVVVVVFDPKEHSL